MNKWLRDRQLGKIVKKEKILQNVFKCTKFEYNKIIKCDQDDENRVNTIDLQWTNDGHNVVSLIYDIDENGYDDLIITIWKNPNSYSRDQIESRIFPEQQNKDLKDYNFESIVCHDSSIIMTGRHHSFHQGHGLICSISMSTGQTIQSIRNRCTESHIEFTISYSP